MRWLYITIIVILVLALVVFAAQNLEPVTISFLGFSARAPLALLAVIVYLVGMATGSSLVALIRKSIAEARGHHGHAARS